MLKTYFERDSVAKVTSKATEAGVERNRIPYCRVDFHRTYLERSVVNGAADKGIPAVKLSPIPLKTFTGGVETKAKVKFVSSVDRVAYSVRLGVSASVPQYSKVVRALRNFRVDELRLTKIFVVGSVATLCAGYGYGGKKGEGNGEISHVSSLPRLGRDLQRFPLQ